MKYFISIMFILCISLTVNAQIKDNTKSKLRNKVVSEYLETGLDGCYMYKAQGKYILVSITSVNTSNIDIAQRIAQIKATRQACEFLNSAYNRSVTTYVLNDSSNHSCYDDKSDDTNIENVDLGSITNNNISENDTNIEEHTFSDKIIQSSIGHIKNMQCLKKLNNTYMYFVVL